jgi:hypothetical protein
MNVLWVAVLLLPVLLFPCSAFSNEIVTADMNGDGTADGWSYIKNGQIQKQEIDMNYDGNIDTIFIYDVSGSVVQEILDTDYDGDMDNWREYQRGELVLDSIDSNKNGKADVWLFVDQGRIYKMGKDTDGDGVADQYTEF